ncbi:MAG: hypothetical protein ACTSWY_05090 [Promethearchaeota archaeon]
MVNIILIYGVYGGIIILFSYFSFSVLKRDPKNRILQMFSLFLMFSVLGLIDTLVYRTLDTLGNTIFTEIGNRISMFLNTFTLVFLLLFNMIILKGDLEFTRQKIITYTVIYALICSPLLFIPAVYFTADQARDSVYTYAMPIYGLIIAIATFLYILKIAFVLYRQFTDKKLRRRYLNTILAICMFMWVLIGTYLANWLNNPTFRLIFTISALIIYPAGILLYQGMKKRNR